MRRVNQNSKDKTPSPGLGRETLRAILENTPLPATLLNGVVLQHPGREAIIPGAGRHPESLLHKTY